MLAAFDKLCPAPAGSDPFVPAEPDPAEALYAAAQFELLLAGNRLQQLSEERSKLKKEVAERTEWALETGQQLKYQQKRHEEWIALLEAEMTRLQQMVAERQAALEDKQLELEDRQHEFQLALNEKQAELNQKQAELKQLESDYQTYQ